ncbi:MAG: GTPase Era, partial [Bdellovibrio sp. CG10_big_fil_rev_8_21_14_0_10_47_8]
GKSSLMNLLVQEKVSIVTAKPQTTRRRVLGIVSRDEGQIVFVDAPGVLNASEGLNRFLSQEAADVIEQSDVLMAVLSVDMKSKEMAEKIIQLVDESKKPWFAVITKTDLKDLERRVDVIKELCAKHKSCFGVVAVSTKETNGQKALREEILKLAGLHLPITPEPLYDVDLFTPHSMKEVVTEIIRERCFEILHHELPYQIAVRVQKYDESDETLPKIYAEILVAKASHKPILVGKGGATIKQIGIESRKSIEEVVGNQVFLSLEVSVRDNWTENKKLMKELGYVVE